MKTLRTSGCFAVALAVSFFVLVVPATTAFAVSEPQRKTAVGMAEQAAKAFQSGDMDKAADLYLLAARTDPEELNYLFGAARAEQSARRFDAAEQHYKAFAASPKADPARVAKVERYLTEMRGERAVQRASEAERLAQKGDPILAASTWLEAYQLAPDRPQYLLSAAVAEREAGDSAGCVAHLEAFLRVAPPEAFERAKAQSLLAQMRKTAGDKAPPPVVAPVPVAAPPTRPASVVVTPPAVAKPVPSAKAIEATPKVSETVVAAEANGRSSAGLWTLVGGAAIGVAGVAVFAWGLSERADYASNWVKPDGTIVTTKSHADIQTYASNILTHQIIGGVLGSAGLVGAGVGAWLWLRTPERTSGVLPTSNGVAWSMRF